MKGPFSYYDVILLMNILKGGITFMADSRVAARGVRKVNEQIVQEGRALIITNENEANYSWEDIPYGSIKVDSQKGLMFLKLEGESDWIPSHIIRDNAYDSEGNLIDNSNNGYTVSIAKDSIVCTENYTITSINQGTKTFKYRNENDQIYTGTISDKGFHFELHKGHYACGRNLLEVIIDDCLYRSASSGGVIEQSETKFILTETPVVGMELTIKYIRLIRIGNPYPRIFLRRGEYDAVTGIDSNGQPEDAEVGDMWIDFSGDPEAPDGYLGEVLASKDKISWSRITGYPATVDLAVACGLMKDVGKKVHTHNINDLNGTATFINSIVKTKVNNATHADKADVATNAQKLGEKVLGYKKGEIPYLDNSAKIPVAQIPTINATNVEYNSTYTVATALAKLFTECIIPKNVIVPFFGTTAPDGWAICNGSKVNGVKTPDLRGLFLRGADTKYAFGNKIAAGLPNITGTFGSEALYDNNTTTGKHPPTGAFYRHTPTNASNTHITSSTREVGEQLVGLDASRSNKIYGNNETVMPDAYAINFIIKL